MLLRFYYVCFKHQIWNIPLVNSGFLPNRYQGERLKEEEIWSSSTLIIHLKPKSKYVWFFSVYYYFAIFSLLLNHTRLHYNLSISQFKLMWLKLLKLSKLGLHFPQHANSEVPLCVPWLQIKHFSVDNLVRAHTWTLHVSSVGKIIFNYVKKYNPFVCWI